MLGDPDFLFLRPQIEGTFIIMLLLGHVALGAQRPIVVKLSRVGRSVQCIVGKRRIGSGCRLAS